MQNKNTADKKMGVLGYIFRRIKKESGQNGIKGLFFKYRIKDIFRGMLLVTIGALSEYYLLIINKLERNNLYIRIFRKPVVTRFSKMYYMLRRNTIDYTMFMGKPLMKYPTDLWVYQEIIYRCKPDVIIETGVFLGGSTYFFAKLCELYGHGRVIGVDYITDHIDPELYKMPNVEIIAGSSIEREIIEKVKALIKPEEKVMVILDSNHEPEHVAIEMELFSNLVTEGQYLVAEDGMINHVHPIVWRKRGPLKAINNFLLTHKEFNIDHSCNRYLLTQSPVSYLYKKDKMDLDKKYGVNEPVFNCAEDCLRPYRLWLFGMAKDAYWQDKLNQGVKEEIN